MILVITYRYATDYSRSYWSTHLTCRPDFLRIYMGFGLCM